MTAELVRTVPAVLERFGSTFSEFTAAFNEGQYVLWLGSGISRDRVPNVYVLLECLVPGLMEALNPREDESHGSTEEVSRGASGASDPDGGRRAA